MRLPRRLPAGTSRLPRPTIRLRLTLFYGALFLASGAALLAVTYVLVRFAFTAAPVHSYASTRAPAHPGPSGTSPPLARLPSLTSLRAQEDRQRGADLHQLLVASGGVLVVMALVSEALGWLVAGRFLRPLRTITAAARDASTASLHRRLALAGPDDELKELGDTFDRFLARMERSFQAQRQFVANASHELRTPLTLERALVEGALTDPEPTAEALRSTCERVLAATTQLDRLIESLLTLATSERGIERWQPMDLAVVAGQAFDPRQADGEHMDLRIEAALGPAPASGDPDLAERLVANLIDNALRHNIPGGWVKLITHTDRGEATVCVSNTGPEVPGEELPELFRPFRRLGGRRTRHDSGHGLGLSIVSAIAAAHHAIIDARARPCGGLEVEVRFPAEPGNAVLPG